MARQNKKYNFGVKRNGRFGFNGVRLNDGTWVIVKDRAPNGMTLMFPKRKFTKLFTLQMKDKTRDYIGRRI